MDKFYDREKEIAFLRSVEEGSFESARMTYVIGRRRIGKTELLTHVFTGERVLYFYLVKKSEPLLCEEFVDEIQNKLGVTVRGNMRRFQDIFGYLMDMSKEQQFTVIIDEFQEFNDINPSIYGSMQKIWDLNKNGSKINLFLCGSIYSLMNKIFCGSKQPLFGRATAGMKIYRFDIKTIKEILNDYHPQYSSEDLLTFYMFTGGVAKYVDILATAKAFSLKKIMDVVFSENSFFLDEGRNMLIEEFGKDYGNYFSILSLIASSKTSRTEIESIMNISTGGFLDKLEHDFQLIKKIRPIFAKPGTKSVKYRIDDNFLSFWFRFIFKYRSLVEVKNFNYLRDIITRDYKTYSGLILERYFREKIIAEENISDIGTYWEHGNKNEIDIIAINEDAKWAIIAEVKRNRDNINLRELEIKAANLVKQLPEYDIEYRGLSMEDM